VTEDTNQSDNSLPRKVPSPRQATPATQRDPSEGEDTNKSDNSLPPEVSSPRQAIPATLRDPSEGVQDETRPNEARLRREQQDAPTAVSSTRELQESQPTEEPTREEQQNLRRSTRQTKPAQRLIEAIQAELREIFSLYLHEARKQPDRKRLLEAKQKEAEGQINHGNFSIIPRSQVPQ
jgi:hypothetical protein